jgi:hypothetical protein
MRARDTRAIAFWIASSVILLFASYALSHNLIVTAALLGAYNAWLLTRRRARRVLARVRGDVDWSGYYQD